MLSCQWGVGSRSSSEATNKRDVQQSQAPVSLKIPTNIIPSIKTLHLHYITHLIMRDRSDSPLGPLYQALVFYDESFQSGAS